MDKEEYVRAIRENPDIDWIEELSAIKSIAKSDFRGMVEYDELNAEALADLKMRHLDGWLLKAKNLSAALVECGLLDEED